MVHNGSSSSKGGQVLQRRTSPKISGFSHFMHYCPDKISKYFHCRQHIFSGKFCEGFSRMCQNGSNEGKMMESNNAFFNGWGCDQFGGAGLGIYPPLRRSLRTDPLP
jgi:hypothetical protein